MYQFDVLDELVDISILLTEIGKTPYAAIHKRSDGKERIVYFKTADSLQRAMGTPDYRVVDRIKDAKLIDKAKEKDDKATNSATPPKPAGPVKVATKKPISIKKKKVTSIGGDVSKVKWSNKTLAPNSSDILVKANNRTKKYWNEKLGIMLTNIPLSPTKKSNQLQVTKLMNAFVNSDDLADKMKVVQTLLDEKYIAFDEDRTKKKIYFETISTGLDQEFLSRQTTKAAKQISATIYEIAQTLLSQEAKQPADGEMRDEKEIRRYGKKHFGAKASVMGKHHEYGVAYHIAKMAGLADEKSLSTKYDSTIDKFIKLNGNHEAYDIGNERSAMDIISTFVPSGGVVTGIRVINATARKNNIVDPTDIEMDYEREDGSTNTIKLSLKHQSSKTSITLRTLGLSEDSSFSNVIGGSIGKNIQNKFDQDINPNIRVGPSNQGTDFDPDSFWETETDEAQEYKTAKKIEFTHYMAEQLGTLQHTKDGQTQLKNIWKQLHGCRDNVFLAVTSNITTETEVRGPKSYCEPEDLTVTFNGKRISVRMAEDKSSYLEFNYRERTKSAGVSGQIQVLRKLRRIPA